MRVRRKRRPNNLSTSVRGGGICTDKEEKMNPYRLSEQEYQRILDFKRDLHMYPELSGQEYQTTEKIRSFLETLPDFRKNVCVVLDEDVRSASDVRKLDIETGDMIALEPRFAYANGYLKSRFVDDKACVAVLLAVMKTIREENICLGRKVYAYFAAYEEIGHGTSFLPEDVEDILAVDIAPTGPDQNSDERKVSIFAKDSRFPYHYGMTSELRQTAIDAGVDYVMDIFTPHYGTDCDTSLVAGHDVRHAAIGPGTANSHGYERTHIDGLRSTYELLMAYLKQ